MDTLHDLSQRFCNLRDNLDAWHLPLLGRRTSLKDLGTEIFESQDFKTVEQVEEYNARVARAFARLHNSDLTIQGSENDIVLKFHNPNKDDVSGSAWMTARYLTKVLQGSYGNLGGMAPIDVKLPVWITAHPVTLPEMQRSIENTDNPVIRAKMRNLNERAVNFHAPGYEPIEFSELVLYTERKACIDINFPNIEIVLTLKPKEVREIAKRLKLDLNVSVQKNIDY